MSSRSTSQPAQLQYDLSNEAQARQFQYVLSNLLNGIYSQLNGLLASRFLAGVLAGNLGNPQASFTTGSSQTVDATGASAVSIFWTGATTNSPALTINNLSAGIPVFIKIQAVAASPIFTINATEPGGAAYAINAKGGPSSSYQNMVSAGAALTTSVNYLFFGCSSGADLELIWA